MLHNWGGSVEQQPTDHFGSNLFPFPCDIIISIQRDIVEGIRFKPSFNFIRGNEIASWRDKEKEMVKSQMWTRL